jgi:sigma-E factor negative regulatory protein RseC
MTESEGVVARVEGEWAWVAVCKASACGNCDSQEACGSGLLAAALGPREYRVANGDGARVGDTVILSVVDGSVAKAASISYLGPLALAIAGAVAGNAVAGDDGALVGVCVGLALGAALLPLANRWFGAKAEPRLTMRVKPPVIPLHREARP